MLGGIGPGNFGRRMMRASYRDTSSGFRVRRGKRSSKAAHATGLANGRTAPKRHYPKIKPRRVPARRSFEHDFMAPVIILFLGAAGALVAATALPVHGGVLMLLMMSVAVALVVGMQVAGAGAGNGHTLAGRRR